MRYILDTHVLLWWLNGSENLSLKIQEKITNPDNIVYVSAVNIWEIEIKKSLGKLEATAIDEKIIRDCNFEELPVNIKHIMALKDLPNHHNDPFDRLLICQSIVEKAPLLSEDKLIEKYKITA